VKILDVPKSGRCGDFVFYVRGNKQCRRRYVLPKDPRTAGQLRARVAFGAASKAWSHSPQLTQEQREAWRKAAAKVQSRPRLGQSGPLTGQQHFVGRKCAQGQLGGEENKRGCGRKREGKRASLQVFETQRVARSTWEHYRSAPGVPRWQCRQALGSAWEIAGRMQRAQCRRGRWGLAKAGRNAGLRPGKSQPLQPRRVGDRRSVRQRLACSRENGPQAIASHPHAIYHASTWEERAICMRPSCDPKAI